MTEEKDTCALYLSTPDALNKGPVVPGMLGVGIPAEAGVCTGRKLGWEQVARQCQATRKRFAALSAKGVWHPLGAAIGRIHNTYWSEQRGQPSPSRGCLTALGANHDGRFEGNLSLACQAAAGG